MNRYTAQHYYFHKYYFLKYATVYFINFFV